MARSRTGSRPSPGIPEREAPLMVSTIDVPCSSWVTRQSSARNECTRATVGHETNAPVRRGLRPVHAVRARAGSPGRLPPLTFLPERPRHVRLRRPRVHQRVPQERAGPARRSARHGRSTPCRRDHPPYDHQPQPARGPLREVSQGGDTALGDRGPSVVLRVGLVPYAVERAQRVRVTGVPPLSRRATCRVARSHAFVTGQRGHASPATR